MTARSLLTIISGGSYAQREEAVVAALALKPGAETVAVVLEGLPEGNNILQADAFVQLHRIAPGCMCCIGNLVMRVTLNRILRKPPSRLYLCLASSEHLEKIILFLQQDPYNQLLDPSQNIYL